MKCEQGVRFRIRSLGSCVTIADWVHDCMFQYILQ